MHLFTAYCRAATFVVSVVIAVVVLARPASRCWT